MGDDGLVAVGVGYEEDSEFLVWHISLTSRRCPRFTDRGKSSRFDGSLSLLLPARRNVVSDKSLSSPSRVFSIG